MLTFDELANKMQSDHVYVQQYHGMYMYMYTTCHMHVSCMDLGVYLNPHGYVVVLYVGFDLQAW